MESGGMQLRKWASNSNAILEAVPAEHRECRAPLELYAVGYAVGTRNSISLDSK